MSKPKLTEKDFQRAASSLRCDVPAIKAVAEVESRGEGFYPDGFPVILFERHKFHKYTNGAFAKKYPEISNARAGGYGKAGQNQRDKFNLAFSLDPVAAMLSCSWGKFQIMGFNHKLCGFETVGAFVDAMKESEGEQLQAFVSFVKNTGLSDELRNHQWARFAQGYNGEDYKKNAYDAKMANAYAKFLKQKPMLSIFETVEESQNNQMTLGDTAESSNTATDNPASGQPTEQHAEVIANVGGAAASAADKAKIEAATALPDTHVKEVEKTGFIKKMTAFITMILTGQYIVPQFLTDGMQSESFGGILTHFIESIGRGLWSMRYFIFAGIALWFVVRKFESLFIRFQQIKSNTDPTRGNVVVIPNVPPVEPVENPNLWQRIKNLF